MKKIKIGVTVFVLSLAIYGGYSLFHNYGNNIRSQANSYNQKLIRAAKAFQNELKQ